MHRESGLSRRGFIGATATGSAAVMAGPAVQTAAAHELPRRERENLVPRQNIGIQLYSLRDMAAADLPATFDMLEDIGYPEVELFQLHGRTAAELRALLDARGLRAIGAHVGIDRWRNELETVLDEAEALGMPYVGVPGIFPPPPPEVSEWRSLARELNRYGEAAADRGLRFYYHNHDFEFAARRRPGALRPDARPHGPGPRVLRARHLLDRHRGPSTRSTTSAATTSRAGRCSTSRTGRRRRRPRAELRRPGEGIINFPRIFRELQNKHYHHFLVERDTQPNPRRTAPWATSTWST